MDITVYARIALIALLTIWLLVALYTAYAMWRINKFISLSLFLTVTYIALLIFKVINHD